MKTFLPRLLIFGLFVFLLPIRVVAQEDNQQNDGSDRVKLVDALIHQLDVDDPRVRIEAGIRLQETATVRDITAISQLVKQGTPLEKQKYLIRTLGALADPRATDALQFELRYGKPETAQEAIIALGKIKSDWSVPLLTQEVIEGTKGDEQRSVLAAAALGNIGTNRALDALRDKMRQSAKAVRASVDWALAVAEKKVDPSAINSDLPEGQVVNRLYKGQRYYFYQPSGRRRNDPKPNMLVCIHDRDLELEKFVANCVGMAKKHNFSALIPFFDPISFPYYAEFNLGFERPDKRLLELVDFVGKTADLKSREIYLYGAGAGAGFIERFLLAYPDRIARAVLADPEIMLVSPDVLFPGGIGTTPLAPDLSFDFYKFIKSDALIVANKDANSNVRADLARFFQQLFEYENREQVRGRIGKSADSGAGSVGAVENFLFSQPYSLDELEGERKLKKISLQ